MSRGQPGDRPWRLGINDPRGAPDESFATIELRDGTFSTSGDYERSFMKDGVRFHHLLDPDTGLPARGCRSVTIGRRRATLADGLSTGVFILGPEAGMALVERLPDVEAVIVTADNRVLISSGLQGKVTDAAAADRRALSAPVGGRSQESGVSGSGIRNQGSGIRDQGRDQGSGTRDQSLIHRTEMALGFGPPG